MLSLAQMTNNICKMFYCTAVREKTCVFLVIKIKKISAFICTCETHHHYDLWPRDVGKWAASGKKWRLTVAKALREFRENGKKQDMGCIVQWVAATAKSGTALHCTNFPKTKFCAVSGPSLFSWIGQISAPSSVLPMTTVRYAVNISLRTATRWGFI
jgi:hypothetical protein